MLKQIPKSDINLRPFKVYKQFTANQFDSGSGFKTYLATNNFTASLDLLSEDELHRKGMWHQLYTMYYKEPDNPYISFGDFKSTKLTTSSFGAYRALEQKAAVITIPQTKFGEKIKPTSLVLDFDETNERVFDDGYGNLISNDNSFELVSFNVEEEQIIFKDAIGQEVTLNLWALNALYNVDANTGIFYIKVDSDAVQFTDLIVDVQNSTINFIGDIALTEEQLISPTVGNIFYSHGLITITRQVESGSRSNILNGNWDLSYQSTKTIYENEIFINVNEGEFNVSTNPTAIIENNIETKSIIVDDGIWYQVDARSVDLNIGGGYVLYNDTNNNEVTLAIDENTVYTFYASEIIEDGLIGCSLKKFNQTKITWKNSDKYQKAEFNNYEYSSSIDPTGSYLAPYITTIGLYDENYEMVAVAKLPTPIKSFPDLPVNFLIRIDT